MKDNTAKRKARRKHREEHYAEVLRQREAALLVSETLILEIEVKVPKSTVDFAKTKAYGLEGEEEHDTIMQSCVNTIHNKPLRDFEITGWGFKKGTA